MEKAGLRYKTITGMTSSDKINIIVNNYNAGLIDILLLSSAGSESLDFKNTRSIHFMEEHWNQAKLDQVGGRAARMDSHSALPPDERRVDIYHWISVFPPQYKNQSADQYLAILSKNKMFLQNQYKDVIIESSIEANYKNI